MGHNTTNQTFLFEDNISLTFNLLSTCIGILFSVLSMLVLQLYLKKLHMIIKGLFLSMFIQQFMFYSLILGGLIAMGFFQYQNWLTCSFVVQGTIMIGMVQRSSVALVSIVR